MNNTSHRSIEVTANTTENISFSFSQINGKISDINGDGVANARVGLSSTSLYDENENNYGYFNTGSILSDENGNFSFLVPAHNNYNIYLTPPADSELFPVSSNNIDFSVDTFIDFVISSCSNTIDKDGDGTGDACDLYPNDYDNDGLPADVDPDDYDANFDQDGDGISNADEYLNGTDPLVALRLFNSSTIMYLLN